MSADPIPAGSPGRPAKRVPSVNSVRSAKPSSGKIPARLQTPNPLPKNGGTVFDPEAFLTRTGVGKHVLNLKKNEMAYAQGDLADAIFYVQKGQLRVTVTSANGKEATIALVSAREFLGEDCMISALPVQLATATAMTECTLLKIARRKWSAYFTKNTRYRMCSFLFCLPATLGSRRIWSISFLIPAKSGLPEFCYCSPSSARKPSPRRWFQRSARKFWRR